MPYTIEVWQEGDVWCARTPDRDTFRHTDLAHAIGEIFWRVTAAVSYAPCHLRNASDEKIGKFMMENGAARDVSIVHRDLKTGLNAANADPSHPLNLYESLVAETR